MRQTALTLLSILCVLQTSTAQAGFVTCEDARQYGENSARLFVGQSFTRIACDGMLRERVHSALDRVLARQVLRTHDSDDEKVCFYEGMFAGLRGQLLAEYAACAAEPSFVCLPSETLASHVGSLLSALVLSLQDPSSLSMEDLLRLFDATLEDEPSLLCDASCARSCADALLVTMSVPAFVSSASSVDALGELLCGG